VRNEWKRDKKEMKSVVFVVFFKKEGGRKMGN
jgi:hypothetical protein